METFSALLALCAGNSPVTCEFPSQRPVTRSFDILFDLRLDKQLSNLRRNRAHYDVTVMISQNQTGTPTHQQNSLRNGGHIM